MQVYSDVKSEADNWLDYFGFGVIKRNGLLFRIQLEWEHPNEVKVANIVSLRWLITDKGELMNTLQGIKDLASQAANRKILYAENWDIIKWHLYSSQRHKMIFFGFFKNAKGMTSKNTTAPLWKCETWFFQQRDRIYVSDHAIGGISSMHRNVPSN